jgi:transcriptional regulator with XRE-family HTH domain
MNHHNQKLVDGGRKRYERLVRLRAKGLTVEDIAVIEGCSKQRVSQILKKYGPKEAACPTA